MEQRISSTRFRVLERTKGVNKGVWTTERTARLIVGLVVLVFTLLGYFVHAGFYFANAFVAFNLVLASLTENCLFHKMLLSLGFKDREEVYK